MLGTMKCMQNMRCIRCRDIYNSNSYHGLTIFQVFIQFFEMRNINKGHIGYQPLLSDLQ